MPKTIADVPPGPKKPKRSSSDLTQTDCEGAKPGPKQVILWDAKLRGFCLRITPQRTEKHGRETVKIGGAKSFYLKLSRTRTNEDGTKTTQPTWIRIGAFMAGKDSDLTVEVARKRAQGLKDLHEQGRDVRALREEQRNPDDVAQLVKEYKADRAFKKLRSTTQRTVESYLDNHLLPRLGKRYVRDLTKRDVDKFYGEVEEATSHVTANRLLALLSVLMAFAATKGMRAEGTVNPCKGVKREEEVPRDRVMNLRELAVLGSTLDAAVAAGKQKPKPKDTLAISETAADVIRFLLFTGLRLGEALTLKWQNLDLDGAVMVFDVHKTSGRVRAAKKGKAAAKGKVKRLPIPPAALVVLRRRKAWNEAQDATPGRPKYLNPFVFRGHKVAGHLVGIEHIWQRIREEAGLDETARDGVVKPHDFRRTYHTTCVELGYPEVIGDYLLGHAPDKIRGTYTNLGIEGILAQAATEVSTWISEALAGRNPEVGKKVTSAQA